MTPPIRPQSEEMRVIGGPGISRSGRRFERIGSTVSPALATESDARRTFYVETYGCEMNQYDSDFIASRFLEEGYAPAPDPESADVLLFNTCSVRQGAEDRVRARIRSFAGVKARHPDMTLGIVGCMAQRLGERLGAEERVVDLVAGTDTYRDLPALVEEKRERSRAARAENPEWSDRDRPDPALIATPIDAEHTYAIRRHPTAAEGPIAFLTIMQGCDKFCTF
ncbi:MAG: hypothetical protein KC591_13555, partial [Gemmatimonadetes bacterium]|nr:hypothetical protein [Gemmatimonadota bacterium]